MVQDVNTSVLNTNHERASTCSRLALCDGTKEFPVIVWNNDTNDQRTKDIESNQSVDKPFCSFWDVPSGSFCFTSSGSDQFWREDKGKSRPDEGIPESEKSPSSSRDFVGIESAWILPVTKAETVVCWSTSKEYHNSCDDETDDGENFD